MQYHLFVLLFIASTLRGEDNFDGPALHKLTDRLTHGECPTWDSRTNVWYYVDVHLGKIFRYNYTNNEVTSITVSGEVAPVVPSKSDPNTLIVGLDRSIVAVKWNEDDTNTRQSLVSVAPDLPNSRMNDGKADKNGRIWFGTMGKDGNRGTPNEGSLYKISKDSLSSPEIMISPVNISNGMAWNKADDKYYYIDSPTLQVWEFDYDAEVGTISNRRTAFDLTNYNLEGEPDGMTIDEDDNLWIALFGGGSVIQVNPSTGELLQRIPIPARDVTSLAWGGPDLDILFITTSLKAMTTEEIYQQPGAGCVFALTNVGTKGLPAFEADLTD